MCGEMGGGLSKRRRGGSSGWGNLSNTLYPRLNIYAKMRFYLIFLMVKMRPAGSEFKVARVWDFG